MWLFKNSRGGERIMAIKKDKGIVLMKMKGKYKGRQKAEGEIQKGDFYY
jgi:hypothetical protein